MLAQDEKRYYVVRKVLIEYGMMHMAYEADIMWPNLGKRFQISQNQTNTTNII